MKDRTGLAGLHELADRHPPVSPEEEKKLLDQAASGDDQARERLVLHNLRLVMDVARRYNSSGADYEDLIHEGISGLLRALDRFDPEKKVRFSTYAHWWIRQGIARFVKGPARVIRIPEYLLDKLARVHRAREAGEEDVERLAEYSGLEAEELLSLGQLTQPTVSLDGNSWAPGESLLDARPHPDPCPEEQALTRSVGDSLSDSLEVLNERERKILQLRYSDGGRRPKSYGKVAPFVGISSERVRQIERQALRKLRKELRSQELRAA